MGKEDKNWLERARKDIAEGFANGVLYEGLTIFDSKHPSHDKLFNNIFGEIVYEMYNDHINDILDKRASELSSLELVVLLRHISKDYYGGGE